MEKENYDFIKIEDQQSFDQLSQEEKDRHMEIAHIEALEENEERDSSMTLEKRKIFFKKAMLETFGQEPVNRNSKK